MDFRRFHLDDLDEVITLHFAGLDQFGVNLGVGSWDNDITSIHDTYLKDNGDFIVCCMDGMLIGWGP